jgi:integrase
MPKLKNRPVKYLKVGKYAVVYLHGKRIYLGLYGSPESQKEYARIVAEKQSNPMFFLEKEEKTVSLDELGKAYLEYAKRRFDKSHCENYRTALGFALDLYGHKPVDEFSPKKLKTARDEMVRSGRFCRAVVNRYTSRILTALSWGVENELVEPRTVHRLREVKALPKRTPGTFESKKRRGVPDNVVKRTLPFLPPTVAAMVQVQRLTGLRPSEVFRMTVGNIDTTQENGLWYYTPDHHKTEQHTDDDKIIPLGLPEQKLIAPYLTGKKSTESIFSPRTAMQERNAEKRANRKTKITPSQMERNAARATKPSKCGEFYDKNSYNRAVTYAIRKGNKAGEAIPHWTPYQLRHSAGTETSKTEGREKAQALLTHSTIETTGIYDHSALEIMESLARNRRSPFA